MILLLLLVLQDPVPPFRATMTIERYLKREDRVALDTGELAVRPGEALLFQSRRTKLLLRGGKGYERTTGERSVKAWDLTKPETFQPLDLWRMDPRAIRERFQEIDDRAEPARELPVAVVGADGKPVPPVAVAPSGGSLAWADGVDRAEGCKRIVLVPREPRLRSRISSIRLSVDRATGRLLRAVVDGPLHQLTLTLGDSPGAAPPDDAVFDWDLSNVKVEDR